MTESKPSSPVHTLYGYADARPSESIQPHADPGIVAAALFVAFPGGDLGNPPVAQYKGGPAKNKARRADLLNGWLEERRRQGLRLMGLCSVHTQLEAATLGLSMIEELPDVSVSTHYSGYRLTFGADYVDFAHAVALEYYLFTVNMAALRAGTKLPKGTRQLVAYLDRFPAASASEQGGVPGKPLPRTEGMRFLEYVENNSPTFLGIRDQNSGIGMELRLDTLDWWKPSDDTDWRKGKTHPLFGLPDWLAVSAMAEAFRAEFEDLYGDQTTEALLNLHDTFKTFDVWSLIKSASHITGEDAIWNVPDDARQYVIDRAQGTSRAQ